MTEQGLRVRAAHGIRWTMIAAVASIITQVVQLVVLSRLLSPREFGLMGMVLVVVSFALAYTDLGISAAIIHRQDATSEQLSSLYWLNIVAGVAVFVLVWLAVPLIAAYFREPALLPLVRAVSLLFLIVPLGKQFEMLLQREFHFDRLARIEVIAAVAGTVAAIGAALRGFGVWALIAGSLVTAVVRSSQLIAVGLREHRPAMRFRRADLRGFVQFGAFQVGEQTVNYLSERLDQLILGRLLGTTTLGLYNLAFNVTAQPVSRINPLVTRVAYPTFCKVQHDVPRLRRGYLQILHLLTSVNAPLLLGLAVVAPLLIPLVFGAKWVNSIPIVQVLCLVSLSRSIGNPIGSLLLARGRADIGFHLNVLLLVLSVPSIYIGARLGGAIGVADALLLLQLAFQGIAYFWCVRPIVGPGAGDYAWAALKPVVLAGGMALPVALVPRLLEASPVMVLATQIVVGAVVYGVLMLLFERAVIRDLRVVALGST